MCATPSRIMLTRDADGGYTPNPGKDNPASATTAPAPPKVVSTISGAAAKGGKCRRSMGDGPAPSARAAST